MKTYLLSCLNKSKAEYAEIRYEVNVVTSIHWVGKQLESIGTSKDGGGAIRVKGKAGWSFSSFNNLDNLPSYLRLTTRQSLMPRDARVRMSPTSQVIKVIPHNVEKDPRQIDLEEKYRLSRSYNQILLSGSETQNSNLRYVDIYTLKYFASSEGSYIQQEKSYTLLGMTSIARRGSNIQSAHEGVGGVGGYELVENQERKAERAVKRASHLLDAEPAKGDKYTVIVDPKLSGVFAHEAFGHLSEADFLFENERLLRIMKLGRRFGSEILNIVDKPPIPGEGGFYLYDDEGVAAGKTHLIKEGKLAGRLHSRETAAKMAEQLTGNARAISYEYPPIVRMSNTYIEKGEKDKEQIISEVKDGIYAKGFRGGQTNLEMFTFAPEEGYVIRNGKITRRIRDFNLTGNIFTTLSQIDAVGNDLALFTGPGGCGKGRQAPLPVSTGGPHIRMKELVVGGK